MMHRNSFDTQRVSLLTDKKKSHRDRTHNSEQNEIWEDMLQACQFSLKKYPNDWHIHSLMGDALLHLSRLDEAIDSFQKVIATSPDQVIFYHKIAVAHSQMGQFIEADRYYTEIFKRIPDFERQQTNNFSVQRQAGDFFFRKQDWERAIEAYQRSIKIEPQSYWEHVNLGRSFYQLGRSEDAVTALQKAIELNHHDGWALYYLAEIFLVQERLDEALECYHKAISLMPNHSDAEKLIAQINSQINFKKKRDEPFLSLAPARTEHKQTVAMMPGWEETYHQGKQLQLQGKLEEAMKVYHQVIVQNPLYSWPYHDLGDIHLNFHQWYEAIAVYHQSIKLNPNYFWSNYNLGVAYRNIGDWKEAIDLYHRSIQLNPTLNLPIKALSETLRDWYNALMQEGDKLLHTNKQKALSLYQEAAQTYQANVYTPSFERAREQRKTLRVLLVVDDHLSQCLRYRVMQKLEQLEYAGFSSEWYSWTRAQEAKNRLVFFDIVIFYRVPAVPEVIQTIKYAKAIKRVVFYEIDDLIFDSQIFPDPIENYGGQVSQEQYDGLVRGTVLFREAMRLCDLAIASTPHLLRQIEKIVGLGNCYLHRNALDSHNLESLRLDSPKLKRDYISIFYGTGTKAHNSDFDELVAPALARLLRVYSQVRLTLMGYLKVPAILEVFQDRIDRVEIIKDIQVYYEFLKQADISIAVLHPTTVNNCKSELKWFEAATFKIPSVVSNTEVYLDVIQPGRDGLVACNPEEWFEHLETLVKDEGLRRMMGEAAHERVIREYGVPVMAENLRDILMAGVERARVAGNIVLPSPQKKLLIVNVFYPPQSIGGATRVVKDNVDILTSQYSDQYEVSVFTTDEGNQEAYQIAEYSHEGVHVTKVSTPIMEGMDWQYKSPKMYEIFKEYLEVYQPDLIHFHCVQRLTASVLEAAADVGIPYLVTAHDAWWISDHQFLVNEQGIECNYQQNDPVIAAKDAKDVTASIQRKAYLRAQLNRATEVLAVSETFAAIYRQNGFPQTKANRNGIQPRPVLPRKPSKTGKVRLAHIGGMATHKGYFLFKEAVEKANLKNTEVIVINHAQLPGTVEYGDWNGVPVTFLAKFKQEEIHELYSMIDVLIAPSMWPESFGLVAREAAAAGVWVVASDKGAIGEDIVPSQNGHVVSVEHSNSFIQVLQDIDMGAASYQQSNQVSVQVRTAKSQVEELVTFYQRYIKSHLYEV